ncbi:uncharacterized protein LOC142231488 [Haematobia irritans]|uniref:uncharacterized protein LOC142231488 n=1 Tax=Haematobia irritans TaxID=7368 RepID=UPI003F4FE97F
MEVFIDTVMNEQPNLKELLIKWNLGFLYDIFLAEDIDINVLKILEQRHIDKIYKITNMTIGQQAMLEYNLKVWKASGTTFDKPPEESLKPSSLENKQLKSQGISVDEILANTSNGKELLKYYSRYSYFNEEQRSLLINTIVKYIESSEITCGLSECTEIENQICSVFPSEQIEFYNTGKRGKIYNKLSNNRRASRNVLKEIESNENTENVIHEDSYGPILQILRSDGISNEEFDIYWRKCAPLRFQQIAKSKHNGEIYQQWPEYFFKSGVNLINIDFALKYPHAADFKERWTQYSDKFAYVMRTKISQAHISNKLVNLTTLNTDSRDFSLLWYLHHLLPPQQRSKTDESGAKFRKRCTVVESQEGFAVVGTSMEEIEAKLNVLKLQAKNIQPRLLMIGEINDVKSVLVYFDNNRYNFLSVLDAFDTLFKIFFVFNLQFPEESDVFYYFIQLFLFNLPTSKKYAKSCSLKHEILAKNN